MLLIVPGRATFRNLSRYSAYVEKTFSRWFRRQVDWAGLNVAAIRVVVPADHESVLAFDPSYVPKAAIAPKGWAAFFRNGSAGRAEQGLEVNALIWVDVTANTAYTISAGDDPPGSGGASSSDTPANPDMPVNADTPVTRVRQFGPQYHYCYSIKTISYTIYHLILRGYPSECGRHYPL